MTVPNVNKRNEVLKLVFNMTSEFSIDEIVKLTGYTRDFVRYIIYHLRDINYLRRSLYGVNYKVWRHTSLMPFSLKSFIENYIIYTEAKRLDKYEDAKLLRRK